MARVQVDRLPGKLAQASGIRAGTTGVVVQQAPEPAIMGLARSLSSVNQMLGNYAKVQEFKYEEGAKQGAAAAAQADLAQAQENLDTVGEQLVNAGKLPRSMLLGYQQAYRKRIGSRIAFEGVYANLKKRVSELNDPEAPEDIVEQILQEEVAKASAGLEGRPLAQQGFATAIDPIRRNWIANGMTKRDAVVQQHNESMVIEEMNRTFGGALEGASTPEQVGQVHNELKNYLDNLSTTSKLPKSRIVELFWKGTAMPAISNLIVSGQPDKAEKMLENVLSIDLTGKNGTLGNVNREGAWIRSNAVELRNRINAERDRIERDTSKVEDDIYAKATIAITAVSSGLSQYKDDNAAATNSIADLLMHAGYDENYAYTEAERLLQSRDASGLQRLLIKYSTNDALKEAYGRVLPRINSFIVGQAQQKQFQLDQEQKDFHLDQFKSLKETDPSLTPMGYLMSFSISDTSMRAILFEADADIKKTQWYLNTDAYKDTSKGFENTLDGDFGATWYDRRTTTTDRAALKANYFNSHIPRFTERYNQLILTASRETASIPNPEEKSRRMTELTQIAHDTVREQWKEYQQTLKAVHDKQKELSKPAVDINKALEGVDEQEREFIKKWYSNVRHPTEVLVGPGTHIVKLLTGVDIIGTAVKRNYGSLDSRPNAMRYAMGIEKVIRDKQLEGKPLTDEETKRIEQFATSLRTIFGYSSPGAIPPGVTIDYRVTPIFTTAEEVTAYGEKWYEEYQKWVASGKQLQNINDYPTLKQAMMLTGQITAEGVNDFLLTQKKILSRNAN